MPAYIVAEVEVTQPEQFKQYQVLAPKAIEKHGGRYLARGGRTVTLEGGWAPPRFVVLEFPSLEKAEAFYNSPEYQQAIATRKGAANLRMVAVEGL